MDIFLIAILIVSSIEGARKGFAVTVKSFLHWFCCIILGIILCNPVNDLISEYTEIPVLITEETKEYLAMHNPAEFIPDAAASWFAPDIVNAETEIARAFSSMVMTVLSFIIVVAGIKLLLFIFTLIFSKKYHHGAMGFTDGFLGFIFGAARGIFYILILFLVFIPLFSLWFPDLGSFVNQAMENSLIAETFYNDNILLVVLDKITL